VLDILFWSFSRYGCGTGSTQAGSCVLISPHPGALVIKSSGRVNSVHCLSDLSWNMFGWCWFECCDIPTAGSIGSVSALWLSGCMVLPPFLELPPV
jgi:hypothetical protein